MDIIKTFLKLTKKTYPYGTEHLLEPFLPKGIQKDKFGNYFHVVGDGDSRVIFASHLDTVSSSYNDVIHTFDKTGKIVGTDGTTTLGADDKAGVTIMLYMIRKKVPGLYYFFIGEEVGCIGSGKVSRENHIFNKENYDKVISFDRRGNTSVITHQSLMRCCSDEFADELCNQLNEQGLGMETDDSGVCTDSLEFIDDIPECTNISVGYLDEHTGEETQDLDFLVRISKACVNVDWEGLPTKRDPSIVEYKKKKKRNYSNTNWNSWNSWSYPSPHNFPGAVKPKWDRDSSMNDRLDMEHEDSLVNAYSDSKFWESDRSNPFDEAEYGPYSDDDDEYDEYGHYNEDSVIDLFGNRDRYEPIDYLSNKERYFETIRDKYLDDRLTEQEIEMIKDQMLDLDDPIDLAFSESMDELVSIKTMGSY